MAACGDDGVGGDAIFLKVGGVVAKEPAADVDGGVGAVAKFNPVAGEAGVGEDFVDDDGFADGEWVVAGAVCVLRADVHAGVVGVEAMGGVAGVDGGRCGLELEVEDGGVHELWIDQQVVRAGDGDGVAEVVGGGEGGEAVHGHGGEVRFGDDGVGHGRGPAAAAKIFLIQRDACVAGDEGVLIQRHRGTVVLDADAEVAADDEIFAQRDGGSLTDGEAFVGVEIDHVPLEQGVVAGFANVNAVAVAALEAVDVAVFDDAVVHAIEVNGVGIRGVVASNRASLDEGGTFFHVDAVARVVGVEDAVAQGA